ncbi:ABC transporter ATP-binding protein [Methanolobus sp.]|jgi:ABC-type multidrug transport system ATPase subunit|uniref:ABC transporter ATP-binding protein n=1 Tax=Methanolobus sp. TaxID=1874737 RepID=UPI0025F3CD89|nr:ABC transporter ATP-binding protein [Methanolobus sp.]
MDSIISVRSLSKSFGRRNALNNIDLEIKKGEIVAIFGPNGAGKTTLLKIMSTIINPSKGTVLVNGIAAKEHPEKIRGMIGAISHETYLYDELTARENLVFFARMYGIENDIDKRVDSILKSVNLLKRADERAISFSRGMKQRLSIARALLHQPEILLMDEPYTGLDQHAAANFERVLMSTGDSDVTRIMITHNIERAFEICDRMLIMDRGEIRFDKLKTEIESVEHFREQYLSIVEKDTDAEGISNF